MTIQFLFNENKIEAMSKVFDFLLITWKRNKIFKAFDMKKWLKILLQWTILLAFGPVSV